MQAVDISPLEACAGYVLLGWDEPKQRDKALEMVLSLTAEQPEAARQKSTIIWYVKNEWGNPEFLDEVLDLFVDWDRGDFHFEQGFDEAEDPNHPVPTLTDHDLKGETFFLQAGHTVSGKGSGYVSPHATSEKNEQKFSKGIALRSKSLLEARGARVVMWDRTEGGFTTHSNNTRRRMTRECPEAVAATQIHWNAATPQAKGHECIAASKRGYQLAVCISTRMKQRFSWSTTRHHDGAQMRSRGRGTAWLKTVAPPAVFSELFFASNPEEMAKIDTEEGREGLAWVHAQGMADFALLKR